MLTSKSAMYNVMLTRNIYRFPIVRSLSTLFSVPNSGPDTTGPSSLQFAIPSTRGIGRRPKNGLTESPEFSTRLLRNYDHIYGKSIRKVTLASLSF